MNSGLRSLVSCRPRFALLAKQSVMSTPSKSHKLASHRTISGAYLRQHAHTVPKATAKDSDGPNAAASDSAGEAPKYSIKRVVNANGTYLDGLDEGLEPLAEYQPGGFHPIHLGDTLGAGRYRVIHKLGHGGFATVWLCRDTQDDKYVAVKVMSGDVKPENVPDLLLKALDASITGAQYIAMPLDSFVEVGPNGTHQCIVLPVLGPRVSPDLWMMIEKDPGPVLRKMAKQAAQAMSFLHKNGVCHGGTSFSSMTAIRLIYSNYNYELTIVILDFRPNNILIKLPSIDKLPEDELASLLGAPQKVYIRTKSGAAIPKGSPQYLTLPADLLRLGDGFLTDQICVIDFGETYPITSPPHNLGTPQNYLPPEILLKEHAVGVACDLWALGCTLFEIRQQIPLFYFIQGKDELLSEAVTFFGKLPPGLWDKWDARGKYFSAEGVPQEYLDDTEEKWSLEVYLSKPMEVASLGQNSLAKRMALVTPEEEQKLMADLLYQLFRYRPEERLSAEEVLAHKWFQM